MVRLESAMAFIHKEQVETRASWDGCVGLRSVLRRIVLLAKSSMALWAISSFFYNLDTTVLA